MPPRQTAAHAAGLSASAHAIAATLESCRSRLCRRWCNEAHAVFGHGAVALAHTQVALAHHHAVHHAAHAEHAASHHFAHVLQVAAAHFVLAHARHLHPAGALLDFHRAAGTMHMPGIIADIPGI